MTASPLQEAIAWLTEVTVSLTFALFALLAFCYPTGRLARGRWRRFAALVLVVIWGTVVISAFWPVLTLEAVGTAGIVEFPNPIGLLRFVDFALPSQSLGVTALPFVMVASPLSKPAQLVFPSSARYQWLLRPRTLVQCGPERN